MSESYTPPVESDPVLPEMPPITSVGNGSVPLRDIPKLLAIAHLAIAETALAEKYPPTEDMDQVTLATAIDLGKVAIYVPSVASGLKTGGPVYEVVMNWDGSRPSVETITASHLRDWPSVCRPTASF